jgi:hypothetical protein
VLSGGGRCCTGGGFNHGGLLQALTAIGLTAGVCRDWGSVQCGCVSTQWLIMKGLKRSGASRCVVAQLLLCILSLLA